VCYLQWPHGLFCFIASLLKCCKHLDVSDLSGRSLCKWYFCPHQRKILLFKKASGPAPVIGLVRWCRCLPSAGPAPRPLSPCLHVIVPIFQPLSSKQPETARLLINSLIWSNLLAFHPPICHLGGVCVCVCVCVCVWTYVLCVHICFRWLRLLACDGKMEFVCVRVCVCMCVWGCRGASDD